MLLTEQNPGGRDLAAAVAIDTRTPHVCGKKKKKDRKKNKTKRYMYICMWALEIDIGSWQFNKTINQ